MNCEICGEELDEEEEEIGVCKFCQGSFMQEDDIDLGLGIEDDC